MSELQVGVHGLRTFRVSDDGNLLPVTAVDDSWRGGVCIARCRRNPVHSAPADRCRCGIYTFHRKRSAPDHYGVNVFCLEGFDVAAFPRRAADGKDMTVTAEAAERFPGPAASG